MLEAFAGGFFERSADDPVLESMRPLRPLAGCTVRTARRDPGRRAATNSPQRLGATIQVWEGYTAAEAKAFAHLVAEYEDAPPGQKVRPLFVNDDTLQKVTTAVATAADRLPLAARGVNVRRSRR